MFFYTTRNVGGGADVETSVIATDDVDIIHILPLLSFDALWFDSLRSLTIACSGHPEQVKNSLEFYSREFFTRRRVVPRRGLEPLTAALKVLCSTR